MDQYRAFVGLDVHKDTISVAVAEADRDGEVRHLGAIPNRPEAVAKLARRTVDRHGLVEFAYEAGPSGYGIYRQLTGLGLPCRVIAPSTIPRRPGDRIKNDTRDAVSLARLLRAGELRFVWVPDEVHEAMRDLVRARQVAANELRTAKARIQMFLLKHGRLYARKPWGYRHRVWLADQSFDHPAQQIAMQSYINAMEQAEARKKDLEKQIGELVEHWSLGPVVNALQALKGVGLIIAASLVAEIGDFSRFDNPRQLMAFLGLVPSEHSSGSSTRTRGITRAGNNPLRALLFEAAWCYRTTPKVGQWMRRARRREGRYLLRSNMVAEDPATLWRLYMQLVEIEQAFKELKHELAIRPIFHQREERIEAHIFVSFIAYCLLVTLKNLTRPRAGGLTPRAIIEAFATIQMVDVHLPTTDGRHLVLPRHTRPNKQHELLLHQLGMTLPQQPAPRLSV